MPPIWAQSVPPDAPKAASVASVTVVSAKRMTMIGQVLVAGTLVAQEEILVYPQLSGSTIDTLLVDIGDNVVAGQALARLNDSTLTAQMAQTHAESARAEASVNPARSQIASAIAGQTQIRARISPRVDATNRLGPIRIAIMPDSRLRTGGFASGKVTPLKWDYLGS